MKARDALSMLQRLEPLVRPAGAAPGRAQARLPLEQQPFHDLLALVSTGQVRSGRGVSVAASITPGLDPSRQDRLASAADLAEASGARRALMIIDGRHLLMDIAQRQVVDEISDQGEARLVAIDAAVQVASAGSDGLATTSTTTPGPRPNWIPSAIARQLMTGQAALMPPRRADAPVT